MPATTTPSTTTKTTARRPTRVRATVDKILSATLQLIAERGASSLSISEVCRTANIARPTFYRHFPTLEDLIDALFKRLCDDFDQEIRTAIDNNPGPENRIEVFASYLAKRLEFPGTRMIHVPDADFSKHLVDKYFENRRAIFEWVLDPLFDLSETLSGKQIDRRLAADILVRYYISLQEHNIDTPEDPRSGLRQLMQALLHLRPEHS